MAFKSGARRPASRVGGLAGGVGPKTREWARARACYACVVPMARVRPRRVRERLVSAGAALADGVARVARFVADVIGAAFGV